jgi:hypothetical protein
MPAAAPRSNTTKKENQLRQKQEELEHTIRSGLPHAKVVRAAESVRAAQLSLLKARLHWAMEARIRWTGRHPATRDFGSIEQIEDATRDWTEKTNESIIALYTKT